MVKRTFEERQNITDDDVLQKLKTLSPFLQQEYLENLLNRFELNPHLRVLASRRLAELYARTGMYATAAKIIKNAASLAPTFDLSRDLHMEAGMIAIKAQDYLLAGDCFRHAIESAAPSERDKLRKEASDLFLFEAEGLEKRGKMTRAVELYEKIIKEPAYGDSVKANIKEKLIVLYEKLGRISESMRLKHSTK